MDTIWRYVSEEMTRLPLKNVFQCEKSSAEKN